MKTGAFVSLSTGKDLVRSWITLYCRFIATKFQLHHVIGSDITQSVVLVVAVHLGYFKID